jgi:hypothetical protein
MLDVFRVMKYSYLGVQWLKYAYLVEYFERVPVRILSVNRQANQSRDWSRFGQTEAGFLSSVRFERYRIFGSETEEGGPRAHHHLGLSCQIFVLGNARHSGEWLKDRKSV